jgi:cytochrome b6-f complex iron-sulfur subunit
MSDRVDRVAKWIDAALAGKRPRRFPAEDDEADALRAATALMAATPGRDLPQPEFIAGLRARIEDAIEVAPRRGFTRRRLLEVSGASAAALVAGAVASRALAPGDEAPPTVAGTLNPDGGRWVAVVDAATVGPDQAVRFTAGAVEGFIVNHAGRIDGVSAVCTHLGCILHFNAGAGRLDCPCHGASFTLAGSPIDREYLSSLPKLATRVTAGRVEVKVDAGA